MKYIGSVKNDTASLEVYECDCGYHMGFDSSFMEQVDNCINAPCPSCAKEIDTGYIDCIGKDALATNPENGIEFQGTIIGCGVDDGKYYFTFEDQEGITFDLDGHCVEVTH